MPTRVFIYECTSAGDASPPVLRSLRREGRAMLDAIVEDFARIPDVVVITAERGRGSKSTFQRLAAKADYALVIAPELHGLLQTRCSWVEQAGGRLLGPSMEAVSLTADKLALASHLKSRGVFTPATFALSVGRLSRAVHNKRDGSGEPSYVIVKPRWGAGSHGIRLSTGIPRIRQQNMIVQPFVPGLAASVAWLIGPKQKLPLLPGMQRLSEDGRFRYLGGRIPLTPTLAKRAVDLTRRAIDTIPGLLGYVGVDVVLGRSASEDYVIEINPRLTTSYLGLRRLSIDNLAEAMLNIVRGRSVAPIRWRKQKVEFACDGSWRVF